MAKASSAEEERSCGVCGEVLVRRGSRESRIDFAKRRSCSDACARVLRGQKQNTGKLPPLTPEEASTTKACSACGETKRLSAFHRSKRDGIGPRCRSCCNGSRNENATNKAAYDKKRRQGDDWKARHAMYCRNWYQKHPERIVAYQRIWRDANRGKANDRHQRRRARLRNAPVIEAVASESLIQQHGSACYLCDKPLEVRDITMDHVIPLSRGGAHAAFNLRPCCKPCNSRKGARLWTELRPLFPDMAERVRLVLGSPDK